MEQKVMEDLIKDTEIISEDPKANAVKRDWMWWWNWSWRPTSTTLLEEAEKKMLKAAGIEFSQQMVQVGNNVYLNTLKAGQGPPLLLLHGFGAGVGFWIANLKELATHHTVYAIDTVGFGRSSRPLFQGNTVQEAEEYFLSPIEAWRQKMGLDKFTVLGHSFGGYLSCLYTLKHPEYVKHLILADPWGVPEKPVGGNGRRLPLWARAIVSVGQHFNPLAAVRAAGPYGPGLIDRFRGDIMAKFVAVYEDISCVSQYIYHSNAQDPSGETAFKALTIPLAFAKDPLCKRNVESIPSDIRVTLMYGENSWMDKDAGMELKNRLGTRADLYVVPGAGHHIYIDNAPYFNQLIIDRRV